MARSKPKKGREYYEALKRLVEWMSDNVAAKGFDKTFVKGRLKKEFRVYERWYQRCENPSTRTSEAILSRNVAKKVVDVSYSIAIDMINGNLLTTDAERVILGIAINKGGGGQIAPPPTTYPVFTVKRVKAPAPGRLTLVYKDYGKKLEGRPPHVSHMEYAYVVSDEMVMDHELLTERGIDTASPIVMDHSNELRGKWFSISGRWVSNGGKAGPWGGIEGFVIP